MNSDILTTLKSILLIAITAVISVFTSAQGAITALFFGFVFNFFIGFNADRMKHSREFSIRKATEGVKLFMFYVITVFFIFAILYENKEFAGDIVNWLTYLICYFYLTNIFRNAKICFPENRGIKFLYEILSTEIFTGIKKMITNKIGVEFDKQEKNDTE